MVIAEGVLQSESVARRNELAQRQRVEDVIQEILASYQGAMPTEAVIRHELPKLALPSSIAEIGDEVSPDLGRLLTTAEHAWMVQVLTEDEVRNAGKNAIRVAASFGKQPCAGPAAGRCR